MNINNAYKQKKACRHFINKAHNNKKKVHEYKK